MYSNRQRVIVGLTIMVMIAGLTCGQAEDKKSKGGQKNKVPVEIAKALYALADEDGTFFRTWTITINQTDDQHCTADIPWQTMYVRMDQTGNLDPTEFDQIRFIAGTNTKTYAIVFPNAAGTPLSGGPFKADNTAFPINPKLNPSTCGGASNDICPFPYTIFNTTGGMNKQCNPAPNNPVPPFGSNGIVVKCGPSC